MESTSQKYYTDRYQPAYNAARLLVSLGTATKIVGWVLGLGFLATGFISMSLANARNAPSAFVVLMTSTVSMLIVILACHLLGSIIAAFGLLVRTTTDAALHSAPSLTPEDVQRLLEQSDR